MDFFASISWYLVVFDECHVIKNQATKVTHAALQVNKVRGGKIGLTGTPVQNEAAKELFTLLMCISPCILPSKNYKEFKEEYEQPIKDGYDLDATEKDVTFMKGKSKHLHSLLNQIMLRRLKDILAEDLPDKGEIVVHCNLSDFQYELYSRML